ncbi:MAG: ribosome maturation factor RimM [Acidobacteriota bacterium]
MSDHDPAGEWLAVGYIRRPHGIHGEIVVDIETDFPDRLLAGVEVGIGAAGPDRRLRLARVREHKGAWLLGFEGMETRDDVEALRDLWIFLPPQPRASLPETYYYEHEIAGLRCLTTSGRELGRVVGLTDGGGGALLQVTTGQGEVLVPFRSPIVERVDLAAGTIVLDPPRGLFDADAL